MGASVMFADGQVRKEVERIERPCRRACAIGVAARVLRLDGTRPPSIVTPAMVMRPESANLELVEAAQESAFAAAARADEDDGFAAILRMVDAVQDAVRVIGFNQIFNGDHIATFLSSQIGKKRSGITQRKIDSSRHQAEADIIISRHGEHAINFGQLDHRNNRDDGGIFEHGDEIIGDRRNDEAQSLWQNDVLQRLPAAHAERHARLRSVHAEWLGCRRDNSRIRWRRNSGPGPEWLRKKAFSRIPISGRP